MIIVAVDDEELALKSIVETIKSVSDDYDVKGFIEPLKALEYIKEESVDVAFLDIKMQGIDGIEMAKRCKQVNSKVNIIFVTAYSEYALAAHNVHSSGYLLKPVDEERVRYELEHLRYQKLPEKEKIYVNTFGDFELFVNSMPVKFSKNKSKELLAYLVNKKGAGATISELAMVLWEDKDYCRYMKEQVHKALKSLRNTLLDYGVSDIIIRERNFVAVDTNRFVCDYYEFLNGNVSVINQFMGEYMKSYSWAEFTTGYLEENRGKLLV